MPRARTPRASKTTQTAAAAGTKLDTSTEAVKKGDTAQGTTELACPECGRTFSRAASLGAHRHQAHKIAGAASKAVKRTARPATAVSAPLRRRRRTAAPASTPANGAANRDALLRTLFPNGIPAKESVIRSVNAWLDEAERLARER